MLTPSRNTCPATGWVAAGSPRQPVTTFHSSQPETWAGQLSRPLPFPFSFALSEIKMTDSISKGIFALTCPQWSEPCSQHCCPAGFQGRAESAQTQAPFWNVAHSAQPGQSRLQRSSRPGVLQALGTGAAVLHVLSFLSPAETPTGVLRRAEVAPPNAGQGMQMA